MEHLLSEVSRLKPGTLLCRSPEGEDAFLILKELPFRSNDVEYMYLVLDVGNGETTQFYWNAWSVKYWNVCLVDPP